MALAWCLWRVDCFCARILRYAQRKCGVAGSFWSRGATVCSRACCAVVPPAPPDYQPEPDHAQPAPGFTGETYKLPERYWRLVPDADDAHVSLRAGGRRVDAAQRVILDIEWDGLATTHTITNESNTMETATHRSGFYLTYAPKAPAQHRWRRVVPRRSCDGAASGRQPSRTPTINGRSRSTTE